MRHNQVRTWFAKIVGPCQLIGVVDRLRSALITICKRKKGRCFSKKASEEILELCAHRLATETPVPFEPFVS